MSPEQDSRDLFAHIALTAGAEAGDVPAELLGDYLSLLREAATEGRRPQSGELAPVGALGCRAAEAGISARSAVELYLSAAWRLWRELPEMTRPRDGESVHRAAEAVLHVVADAVATLAQGYNDARRRMIRREESQRRELVDDLLRGEADVGGLVERAEPFGLDFTRPHQVVLAAPQERLSDMAVATGFLEGAVLDRFGDRDVLVATKDGVLVVVAPAGAGPDGCRVADDIGSMVHACLDRYPRGAPWQVAVGRRYTGSYGIARSYEEAREALTVAARLRIDVPVINPHEMLVYRVLVRDQPAMGDLIRSVLGPLTRARGGAEPLVQTLETYFEVGCVATEAGRRLHLSIRAVTYRLERVTTLTGFDPTNPAHRFTLHAAVLGARLLGWPSHPLDVDG